MKTTAVAAALVASVTAYSATDLPACWSACFAQYDLSDEKCLCDDTTGKKISECIATGCDSSENAAYAAWLESYCAAPSSSIPFPSYPASSSVAPASWSSEPAAPSYSGSWSSEPAAPSYSSFSGSWSSEPAAPSYSSFPVSWSSEPAPVYTSTHTAYTTVCPEETHTPGEVYTTTVTESVTFIPHEKSYSWGQWTSKYTSYESSTCTGDFTLTVTHPASSYPTAPASGSASPSGAPTQPSYSFPAPTKTCSSAAPATSSCVPCEGQGSGPYCGLTIESDHYSEAPITCNVVEYDWTIAPATISPDGVSRPAILVENQFPGPLIHANWGDTVIVKLTNNLPADYLNGTSLHFHGIRQNGTNEYDGVSSITQCPLAPGETMTYKWVATSYGTSWWHAHYSLQTYEGIFGPMIIEGPAALEYDYDQVLILQDWNHATVDSIFDDSEVVVPGVQGGPITLDTGLINGKNVWEGAGEYFSMSVQAGKTYRLRVINTAIQSTFKFHIDGHTFQVIAADFVPIQPYTTNIVSVNIGQRYDLIMTADQQPGNYWIRSDNQQPCGPLIQPNIQGILNYEGVDQADPTTTAIGYAPDCLDEASSNLVPIYAMTVGAESTELHETNVIAPDGQTPNLYKWTLSGSTFLAQWGNPTLYDIWADDTVPDYGGQLTIEAPKLGDWIYIIIDSPMPLPHPIHLHGHDFFVLASGTGAYTPDVALQLDNPPRRDVAVMPADPIQGQGGYLVIAYQTSNPGVWLLHCHIGWHNAMGFALQIIENLDGIVVEDSCQLEDTCTSWHKYAQQYNVFNAPFDSGV